MELIESLEKIGLSKQEAQVYLNTLKLGNSKASVIAQKSNLQRGAAYYTLKLLKEKGCISEVIKSGVKYYSAVSPERLLEVIEDEKKKKTEALNSIIEDLNELKTTSIDKPEIEIFEGQEGFKTIFSKIIEKENQEWRCYLSSNILEYHPFFHMNFRKRRMEKNISIKTLTEKTPNLIEIKKTDKKELRETKFNNNLFNDSNVLNYILDDAVVFIKANKNEQLAVYIKEKEFANLHKNIFDELWSKSK